MKKNKLSYPKIIKILWASFLGIFILGLLYVFAVSIDLFGLFGGQPDLRELENPKDELASQIFSVDNVLIGKFYSENRVPVDYDDIPPHLIKALMATEDVNFRNHSGVNFRSILRVITSFGKAGGGSTLTQQLAKNLFDTRSEMYEGKLSKLRVINMLNIKIKEWLLAIKLEKRYTKDEILTMYLNTVPFGRGAFGIKVASKTYFSKAPENLNIQEAALLVGLINGPSIFNPIPYPERALKKRNFILYKLLKYNHISQKSFDSLKAKPIVLKYSPDSHNEGPAYFKDIVRSFVMKWCREHDQNLYTSGLKIYTTLDSRMQTYAEQAVAEHMKEIQQKFFAHWKGRNPWRDEYGREVSGFIEALAKKTDTYKHLVEIYGEHHDSVRILMNKKVRMKVFSWKGDVDMLLSPMDSIRYYQHFLHTGLMSMTKDGHIKAWVGGINHWHFKYDHVFQQKRQPGSTFKAILYAVAIENGLTPCVKLPDVPITIEVGGQKPWAPQNDDNKYSGEEITLRQALGQSKNLIAAQLIKRYGVDAVIDMAGRLGLESDKIEPVPSIALGSSQASVYEMTGAYNTFLNKGTYVKPQFLLRIEDKYGHVLYEEVPRNRDALNEEVAFEMVQLLKAPVEVEGGTARNMPEDLKFNNDIACKTGTTSHNVDAWFMGFTKDLTTGVWVGGENTHIHHLGAGASMAMPIWAKYMRKVYADRKLGYTKGRFPLPSSKEMLDKIDCIRYAQSDSTVMDGDSAMTPGPEY